MHFEKTQLGLGEMEPDLPLIQMAEEDDSLIQHLPDLGQTPSKSSLNTFSPFALPPSNAKKLKDGVRMEKPSSSSSEAINNKENINLNSVEVPKLGMEPMQMKRIKKGAGFNLRKSLAWDRAFFTDEGILDPVELTLITGIDANTCGGGLPSISEEGNSSFSSDASCTNESNAMEAFEETPLRDKNRTSKGKNREKTDCSLRNHGSLLHHKVRHKVLSSNHTNRGVSKLGGCSELLSASSLKRPANSNTLKTAKRESKLPKLPISKRGSYFDATEKASKAASQLRCNLIPKPTKAVEQNFGSKSCLQNVQGCQSKAKIGSGNTHLPARELAQKTVKYMTHSSKAASSTRSRLVQVDRANSRSELVPDTLQLCKVQEESAPLAAKHLAQHATAISTHSSKVASSTKPRLVQVDNDKSVSELVPDALRVCQVQEESAPLATKHLAQHAAAISDRLRSCESQECPAALARPSGLRMPSPSLQLFGMSTASESASLQQKKFPHYMGSDRKYVARTPMKSNDITENIACGVLTSSKERYAPSTQLSPSPNYMLNSSTREAPDSNLYQNLVTKNVPRVGITLDFECGSSKQEKKVSHPTEQLAGNIGTCRQLMPEGRVPETKYEEDGLQSCTTFSMSAFGQSIQHQEENLSTEVDDLAQTSWEQADTEKCDDAPSKVDPESHLDAGSQVFMESQEHDGIKKREDDVRATKCIPSGIESYSVVLQHGQKNNGSKVVDDSSCSRIISITSRDSHSIEHEADVIDSKSISTSSIPFQNVNTEQRNDDANSVDVFPTTTSPHVGDLSVEEGHDIHIGPITSIRSKAQIHDSPVRDTLIQLLNDNPSAEGFNIGPTTSFENEHQLPVTLLLHDNPSSPDLIPPNSSKNKSQLEDTGTANGSPKCFEAANPCISASLNSQLSEESTFHNVTDIKDPLSQEKIVLSAILSEKQEAFDVDSIPREVAHLDDYNQSRGRPQVEIISKTASVGGDDALVKRESLLQGAQCSSTYPQSLERERLDIAAPVVEAQHKIPVENHKSQELGISVVAEKSPDSRGNISEAEPTVQGCTGEAETHSQFQSENQTLEGSGAISNISKTNVEDGQVQLLNVDVLVQSCSRLTPEEHDHSIENADHSDIHGKQAGFSKTAIKMEQVWNVAEGSDVYECDPRPPNTVIAYAASPVVEEIGISGTQLCVEYRTSGSVVIDSIAERNESYSDGQSTECGDHSLTFDSELQQSAEDKTFVENSTCMESCSLPTDSILEEKSTLFLDERVLMKDSLLSAENISDSVIVPEENSDASAKILPVVQVHGDNQPQGFVGITPSLETHDDFTNGKFNSSFSVGQGPTTDVETASIPELCCLVGGGDESLLTKTTSMIEAEGSKIIVGEQVDTTPMVGEFQHEMDDVKDAAVYTKRSNSIKMQDNSLVIHPPNAVPFSDEWLAAFEAAGEEILTMKCGAVQHSPQDKSLPEPSPWSPVKKKGSQIGPYDCTKYTNVMP